MIVSHYIIGDPHPNEVARDGFTTPFFIGSLILANVVSLCSLVALLVAIDLSCQEIPLTVASPWFDYKSNPGFCQPKKTIEVYDLAYLNHLERVESLRNSYHSRIEDLYSDNLLMVFAVGIRSA